MVDQRATHLSQGLAALQANPDVVEGRLEPALRTINEVCAGMLNCDRVSIWRPTQAEFEFRAADMYESSQNLHTLGESLRLNQFSNFYGALRNERCINVQEAGIDLRTSAVYDQIWKPHHITCVLAAAVRVRGRFEGFVCFERINSTKAWTQPEEAFACQIGDLIGQTVLTGHNRKLRKQLDVYEKTLAQMTQAALPETALQQLVHYTVLLLNASAGLLFIIDVQRKECRCTVNLDGPMRLTGLVLKFGEDAAGMTAETGRSIIQRDYQSWLGRSERFADDGFSEVVTVPIRLRDEVAGVIELLQKNNAQPFMEWDLKMLEVLARQAGVILDQLQGDHIPLLARIRGMADTLAV